MQDYFISMAISTLLVLIKQSVKNEHSKETWKAALLKVRDQINALYGE